MHRPLLHRARSRKDISSTDRIEDDARRNDWHIYQGYLRVASKTRELL